MTRLIHNIYIGDDADYANIVDDRAWAVLHCAKHPWHTSFVGYKGSLHITHPQYMLRRRDNEMALNLVDTDTYDETWLDFYREMFERAFAFLDEYREHRNILIHCNKGESRGPTVALLYSAMFSAFGTASSFDTAARMLRETYPRYSPRNNIYRVACELWPHFVRQRQVRDNGDT